MIIANRYSSALEEVMEFADCRSTQESAKHIPPKRT